MKITIGFQCGECGFQLIVANKPYNHLCYCPNQECTEKGKFYEIPRFEAIPGKAYLDA